MREAVAAVFIYQNEVLSMVRKTQLSVFPGYTSFPGGKVDDEDAKTEVVHQIFKQHRKELVNALQREVKEELSVDLYKLAGEGKIISFDFIGTATTPEFNPYRFKTHFFVIQVNERPALMPDEHEVEALNWERPGELLKRYQKAEVLAVPPTIKLIEGLARGLSGGQQLDLDLHYKEATEVPMIESVFGVKQFLPLSNTFPPAKRTNCFLIGDKGNSVLIDPSPADADELKKLETSLGPYAIDMIFITHHHPDHHEFAPEMARKMGVPIGLSHDTETRLNKKWGEDYLDGIEIRHFKDGDMLTKSLGQRVKVYAVPGHDEGQLALAPESLNWFIVGDLIQTIGTVVIGGDEGDMRKYFESLQKVIYIGPKVIFPSHGIALGGVEKLKMTLKHRQHREEQIMLLLDEGKSNQEILEIVYEGLDPRLHRYALKTIEAHIKKIEDDDSHV